jgi:hypothetical protein
MGKNSRKSLGRPAKVVVSSKGKPSKASSNILKKYKAAGYGVAGAAKDGILIVRPRSKPESFSLTDLEKAFSKTNLKR